MLYVSTRGQAQALSFEDVILTGLASDGGLYVPKSWPSLSPAQMRGLQNKSYVEIALEVMLPFVGEAFTKTQLQTLLEAAYGHFSHAAVTPIKQLDEDIWLMELFHGPTLAFKDVALQLLGLMFDALLKRRGQRVTIVGATSGDTGSAAIEAFRDRNAIDIFILHPEGRTSEVQRRQMTTVRAANVHNIALQGSFDDCQDMVKTMFADTAFRDEVKLSAVNSINWGRILAQVVYYVVAGLRLGAPDRKLDVIVPTGNFGNIFAAFAAKQMGLPIEVLGVASNRNDILSRFINASDMSLKAVEPSLSPSMDIQVSSNFERLLFERMDRDGLAVAKVMNEFRETGKMKVPQGTWRAIQSDFVAMATDDRQTLAEMQYDLKAYGELIDPHTATGVRMARERRRQNLSGGRPQVVMATAHPAKFPQAVEQATGQYPALPPALKDLYDRPESFKVLKSNYDSVTAAIRQRLST